MLGDPKYYREVIACQIPGNFRRFFNFGCLNWSRPNMTGFIHEILLSEFFSIIRKVGILKAYVINWFQKL